jgi:hypothetical protein
MRRRLISIAVLTLSSSLAAQPLPLGANVRVEYSGRTIQGSLIRVSPDSIVVVRGQLEARIPRAEMNSMFRRTSAAKKGRSACGHSLGVAGRCIRPHRDDRVLRWL